MKVSTNAANAIKTGTQQKNWLMAIRISIYEVRTTMNVWNFSNTLSNENIVTFSANQRRLSLTDS
jgi:hypothetical protein